MATEDEVPVTEETLAPAEEFEEPKPDPAELLKQVKGVNVAATMSYVADKFLHKRHYTMVHQSLSKDWDRLHSLSAALKLMEKYGVTITKEEEDRLAALDEERQIEALVMKMPQQSKKEFQQFFLQLQVLVTTATQVRESLEAGRPEEVEHILESSDLGVMPYVLRMAVVQAGSEVESRKKRIQAWSKDMSRRMGPKVRGQEDAMNMQKKLNQAQQQLSIFTASQNEKSKKVVMNFLNGSAEGLKASTFKGWASVLKQAKMEKEFAGEYMERIEKVKAQLLDLKSKSLKGIRKQMEDQAKNLTSVLLAETFQIWFKEAVEAKRDAQRQSMLAEGQAHLQSLKAAQNTKSKSMMARMQGDEGVTLKTTVFSAWLAYHAEYQKEKGMEAEVKEQEKRLQEHIKAKGDSAKKVLQQSLGNTDSTLIQMCYKGWQDAWKEAKEEARLAELINGAESKFANLGQRGKQSGMSAMEKQTYYMDMMHIIRAWNAWKLDTRMEKQMRFYHGKIDAKRKQLIGVQDMFRNFANELEGGLKKANDSSRGDAPAILKNRGLHKSESAVNLPDINKKPQAPSGHTYNPQNRHPLEGGQSGGDRSRSSKAGINASAAYPAH